MPVGFPSVAQVAAQQKARRCGVRRHDSRGNWRFQGEASFQQFKSINLLSRLTTNRLSREVNSDAGGFSVTDRGASAYATHLVLERLFRILLIATRKPGPSAGQNVKRFTVLTKSLKCVFFRIGRVARSRISLRMSGSATAMPLLICASGFSQVGRSDSYSIFATGTCEYTRQGIPIGVPISQGRSFPGPMAVTSSPIEPQRHP